MPARQTAPRAAPSAWDWPAATPDEAGFDAAALAGLVADIRQDRLLPQLHDLVIIRHGRLVLEENFQGRDAAKLGQLYLNKGRWGDVQVVPESWVRESLKMRVDLTVPGQPPSGYGYLWWVWAPDPRGKSGEYIYAARGRFGQYVIVVPEHDMVVVFLGDAKDRAGMGKPIEVFYDRILTALRR